MKTVAKRKVVDSNKKVLITGNIEEVYDFVEQKKDTSIIDMNRSTFRKKVKRHIQRHGEIKKILLVELNSYHFIATIDEVTIIDIHAARKKGGGLQMYWIYINRTAKTKSESVPKHVIDHSIYA